MEMEKRNYKVMSIIHHMSDLMAPLRGEFLAVKITALFLRFSGFWAEETKFGRRIMDYIVVYSISALAFGVFITADDMCHCYGDFNKFSNAVVNVCITGVSLWKTVIFAIQRDTFLNVIIYARKHYWRGNYEDHGATIMKQCMARSAIFAIGITVLCHGTVAFYIVKPLIENRGKNESERVLPCKLWINLPVSFTPWFEIVYTVQSFSAYHACICYFCFDNFLCQLNITLVAQFMILRQELRSICKNNDSSYESENTVYPRFKNCVIRHQQIIAFIDQVRELYKTVILGIVIVLSFSFCMMIYLLMTTTGDLFSQVQSAVYAFTSVSQLYLFMLRCNELTEASQQISHAAYDVHWFYLKSNCPKKKLVTDLSTVILRSQKPCSFSVGGFSAVTLQTFTSVCNTSFSYLALMRQTA